MVNIKSIKEGFANVLESPDRIDFRDFVKNNFGEQDYIDFKSSYPDSDKLAKLIIAFGNEGGGTIIFGINEIGGKITVPGIELIKDKADFKSQLEKYLPENIEYDVIDFQYKDSDYDVLKGKSFQLVLVQNQDRHVPFMAKSDGKNIQRNRIYIRRGTETIEANYIELQKLINRRIDLNLSTSTEIEFDEHLTQLKSLYGHIKRNFYQSNGLIPRLALAEILRETEIPNKKYPKEDCDDFIVRMINMKKQIIEREVRK